MYVYVHLLLIIVYLILVASMSCILCLLFYAFVKALLNNSGKRFVSSNSLIKILTGCIATCLSGFFTFHFSDHGNISQTVDGLQLAVCVKSQS